MRVLDESLTLTDDEMASLTDGPPSVNYHHPLPTHDDYPGGTAAAITLSTGQLIGIGPGDDGKHTALFAATRRGEMFQFNLSRDELDVLIEELQHARAGCFFGQYPEPPVRRTISRTCSARELVEFIKDNVQPNEMLRVNTLDIDVLV